MKFPRLKSKAILAPMAGITNLPFRLLCKEYGAGAVVTEMISSEALVRNVKATKEIVKTDKKEKPVGVQIFGSNPESLAKAAKIVEEDFDFIDLNMGCSVKKIISQKAGSYLMKDIDKFEKIITKIILSVNKPVTIKIRLGYDKINAVEIAKKAEECGVSAITIHPRTAKQRFSGKSDWGIIKKIKENVNIPIIGNGDICSPEDAKKMLEYTKCDYIMVGRAAMGNPFIFKQINHYLKTGELIKQSKQEKINDFLEYVKLYEKYKIDNFNDVRARAMHFTKGADGSVKLRRELGNAKDKDEIMKIIHRVLK